ncbi:hypothetical protein CTEN210_03564 [Chaetoceros tenuissimus]|uniref:RING-type domain-containing protein n=1 Tax=Chaetoceros tenuissimus TaxID=426638 RepID=A0AAD3H241_9STRA|nr:hypothetical protein CTEN210_03564 [Chaetoceros tenuissimus]
MSQQQHLETNLRRSSRRRDRKSYNDYFSDDDVLTEHDDDDIEEQELEEEEEYEDGSDDDYIQEEEEEASVSDDSSDNDSGNEQEANEASVKDMKFACGLCSNILSDPYIIPACCHRFCCKCIQESITAGNGPCPTCRDHSVSFESLRRDEMMSRLLARYKMLQEKIQKKKLDEGGHETRKKRSLDSTATNETIQEDIDGKIIKARTRKKQKREVSSDENSSKTSSSDRKHTKEIAQAKVPSGKKVAQAPKNKKRKAKSSNDILTFNERLQCLREFKKKYGHVNVPADCKDLSCHEGLGRWCSTIRRIRAGTYKRFKNPEFKLTEKRMKVLEDMGFRWTTTKTFDEYFQELQAFKERHGHCYVPFFYKENKRLGSWCAKLRMMKAGTKPNTGSFELTPERIKNLDALGFRWWMKSQPLKKDDTKDLKSQEKIEISTAVESSNGNVPTDVDTKTCTSDEKATPKKEQCVEEHSTYKQTQGTSDDIQNNTIVRKGKRKKKSTMSTSKEGNEFCRGRSERFTFDDYFRDLKAYKAKHGDCCVPATDKNHKKLRGWVSRLRMVRAGTMHENRPSVQLTEERIKELDNIGFRWRGCKTFDEYINDLQEFKAKHGHCDVPYRYPENKSLGHWVGKIRRMKLGKAADKGGPDQKLTKERIAQLERMDFNWRLRL